MVVATIARKTIFTDTTIGDNTKVIEIRGDFS